jgi:hypothetical protein
MDEARLRLAAGDRRRDRVDDERRLEIVAHAPTDDLARVEVHDRGEEEPALVGGDVGDVRHPGLVRSRGGEVAVDEVGRRRAPLVRRRRADAAAATRDALDPQLAHQPGDALLADLDAVAESQLGVQSRRSVGPIRRLPGSEDPRLEPLVLEPVMAGRPLLLGPVALPGDV